jgi:hypothetical protein
MAMTDLPSTQDVGSSALAAIELRPQDGGYAVTGIADDGELVSFGPFAQDLPMAIAMATRIVRLTEFQHDGEAYRARVL